MHLEVARKQACNYAENDITYVTHFFLGTWPKFTEQLFNELFLCLPSKKACEVLNQWCSLTL